MAAHKNWRVYQQRWLEKKGFSSFSEWRKAHFAVNLVAKMRKRAQEKVAMEVRRATPEYRAKRAEQMRLQRQTDPSARILHNLRRRVSRALGRLKKSDSTMNLVGCSLPELRSWLEGWFQTGMTWENYGSIWHVDHHKPCDLFDFTNPEQQRRCFHYLNLRPLFAADNIRKGNKYVV